MVKKIIKNQVEKDEETLVEVKEKPKKKVVKRKTSVAKKTKRMPAKIATSEDKVGAKKIISNMLDEEKKVNKEKAKGENLFFDKVAPKSSSIIFSFVTFFSFLWFTLAFIWVRETSSFGGHGKKLLEMSPVELGSFLSGVLIPVLFLWVIAFYLDKIFSVSEEKNNIYSFLSSVFRSDKKGREFIEVIEGGIKIQVEQLREELKEVHKFSNEVNSSYEAIVKKNAFFIQHLKKQNEFIARLDAKINSKIEDNVARLSVDLKEISGSFEKISENSNKIDSEISSQISNLDKAVHNALENTIKITSEIEGSTEVMLDKTSGSAKKVEKISGDIRKSVNLMDNVFQKHDSTINNVMAYFETQGDVLEASLDKQSEIFDAKTVILKEKVQNGVSTLSDFVKGVDDASNKIESDGDKVEKVLGKLTASMSQKSDDFVNFIANISSQVKEANGSLKGTMQELLSFSKDVKMASEDSKNAVDKDVNLLMIKVEEASKQAKTIKDGIEQKVNDLANVVNQVSSHSRLSEFSLEEQSHKLSKTQEDFVAGLGDMEAKMASVREMVGGIMTSFENNSGAMNEKVAIVSQNISHNLKGVEDVISSFNVVNDSIEVSLNKLNKAGRNIKKAEFGSEEKDVIKSLSAKKKGQNEEPEVKKGDMIDAFVENKGAFSNISIVIEKLNSVAVDLSRIYDPNIQETIWNAYYSGQKNVFAKYLAKKLDKRQIVAVRDLIERNNEFTKYVKDFVIQFEKMIVDASKAEGRDVLLSMLNSSEYGRIYLFFKGLV